VDETTTDRPEDEQPLPDAPPPNPEPVEPKEPEPNVEPAPDEPKEPEPNVDPAPDDQQPKASSGVEPHPVHSDAPAAATSPYDTTPEGGSQALRGVSDAFPGNDSALDYARSLMADPEIDAPDGLTYDDARTIRETVLGRRAVDQLGYPVESV